MNDISHSYINKAGLFLPLVWWLVGVRQFFNAGLDSFIHFSIIDNISKYYKYCVQLNLIVHDK